jgi:hypothetical protein
MEVATPERLLFGRKTGRLGAEHVHIAGAHVGRAATAHDDVVVEVLLRREVAVHGDLTAAALAGRGFLAAHGGGGGMLGRRDGAGSGEGCEAGDEGEVELHSGWRGACERDVNVDGVDIG